MYYYVLCLTENIKKNGDTVAGPHLRVLMPYGSKINSERSIRMGVKGGGGGVGLEMICCTKYQPENYMQVKMIKQQPILVKNSQ